MGRYRRIYGILGALLLAAAAAAAQNPNAHRGVINFREPILPDALLQHSKETYIQFGCAYCHGVDLGVRNGEAADLRHSVLVGRDQNGDLIGPLLRAGIPQTPKLSPMPQFSDLSDAQIADLVRWIHYARQQGQYNELSAAKESVPGSAAAGKEYFEKACASCHSAEGDFAKIGAKNDPASLKTHLLRPEFLNKPQSWKLEQLHDVKTAAARQRHLSLLENYSEQQVANLLAYLETLK